MNLVKDRRCKSKHLSYYDVVEDTDEVTITSEKTRGEYICITKKLKLVKASKVNEKSSHAVTRNLKTRLSKIPHLTFPDDCSGKVRCTSHRFVNRKYEYKKEVLKFTTCDIPVCIVATQYSIRQRMFWTQDNKLRIWCWIMINV